VVHPGFATKPLVREPSPEEPIALFVGAMNRPENWEAAMWFLEQVWPEVLQQSPTARFVIAGANPPRQLLSAIRRAPRAEATGFVESLEPWYAKATVCVVPLQRGAGLKFKTIDALLAGVPVVTTTVGAEGIAAEKYFAAKTDDANAFALATISALNHPSTAQSLAAQQWAESSYGEQAFAKRISDLYGSLFND
jgi:glycosyltransferase involved in cell wall biosynthesis